MAAKSSDSVFVEERTNEVYSSSVREVPPAVISTHGVTASQTTNARNLTLLQNIAASSLKLVPHRDKTAVKSCCWTSV